jgi:hypothetical protein
MEINELIEVDVNVEMNKSSSVGRKSFNEDVTGWGRVRYPSAALNH